MCVDVCTACVQNRRANALAAPNPPPPITPRPTPILKIEEEKKKVDLTCFANRLIYICMNLKASEI